jgi:7-cyano-7-deazaguanine synthase
MKIAVIAPSGGLDSTALLLHLLREKYDIYALSFDYGQKHKIELLKLGINLHFLTNILQYKIKHTIIDLSVLGPLYNSSLTDLSQTIPEGDYKEESMKSTVVPNRNAIFSSIIYGYALSLSTKFDLEAKICLGVHAGDHAIYPDCRPEFYEELMKVFKLGNWGGEKVNSYLPYLQINKAGIIMDALESCKKLQLDFNFIFKNTNTCYNPNDIGESCGKCGSCNERLEAFKLLRIKDPIKYQDNG